MQMLILLRTAHKVVSAHSPEVSLDKRLQFGFMPFKHPAPCSPKPFLYMQDSNLRLLEAFSQHLPKKERNTVVFYQ